MIFPTLRQNLLCTTFMLLLIGVPQALACNNVHPEDKQKRVTLDLDNVEIHQALNAIQKQIDKSMARRRGLKGTVSIKVDNMLWNEAAEQILEGTGYYLVTEKDGDYLINNQYCSRIPLPTKKQEKTATAEELARLAKKEEQRKAAREQWKNKLEQMDQAAAEQEAEKERQKLAEAKTRKHCNFLKDKQRQFDEGRTRWYKLDSQGNRIYLSDQEIDASYKKLGQQIRKVCQ